jgi:hypothetical protein
VTFLAIVFLGLYVLVREKHSSVKTAFFLMTLPAAVWLFAFALMYSSSRYDVARFWSKAAYLGVPFIPTAIYYFTVKVLRIRMGLLRQVHALQRDLSGFFLWTHGPDVAIVREGIPQVPDRNAPPKNQMASRCVFGGVSGGRRLSWQVRRRGFSKNPKKHSWVRTFRKLAARFPRATPPTP